MLIKSGESVKDTPLDILSALLSKIPFMLVV